MQGGGKSEAYHLGRDGVLEWYAKIAQHGVADKDGVIEPVNISAHQLFDTEFSFHKKPSMIKHAALDLDKLLVLDGGGTEQFAHGGAHGG